MPAYISKVVRVPKLYEMKARAISQATANILGKNRFYILSHTSDDRNCATNMTFGKRRCTNKNKLKYNLVDTKFNFTFLLELSSRRK